MHLNKYYPVREQISTSVKGRACGRCKHMLKFNIIYMCLVNIKSYNAVNNNISSTDKLMGNFNLGIIFI